MKVTVTPGQFKAIRDLEARCTGWSKFHEDAWRGGLRNILGDVIPEVLVPVTIELVVDWSHV